MTTTLPMTDTESMTDTVSMTSTVPVPDTAEAGWWPVCAPERLTPERGVAALIDGVPVAVFLLSSGELYALDNVDPFSGASVLSRGIVGDAAGVPTVASPMYKQRFDLRSGACLDDPDRPVAAHEAVVTGDAVWVRLAGRRPGGG